MDADSTEISRRTGLGEKLAKAISGYVPPEAEIFKEIEALERVGAWVITRWDPGYPENLKHIYDPPALLFVMGSLEEQDKKAVAIVGTRNPTRYGIEIAQTISGALARAGVTLISGLAKGIDTACHQAALREGGRTIGVLGCGIDVAYPRENRALCGEIATQGAVMSEFRPGTAPYSTNFYRRNRIVSGLAKGVLVVEATKNSGSLITASHAVDQNRDVFAIPGNILNIRTQGPHMLIKQGAALVEEADDILQALFETPEEDSQSALFASSGELDDLPSTAREVLEALDPDPVHVDLLCETLKMDAGRLSGILLELELRGLVRQHPGKLFARVLR